MEMRRLRGGYFLQHMEAVLKGASKEWASSPPVLIAIWRDEKKIKTHRVMFGGNERAMIYRYLGMPVPVKGNSLQGPKIRLASVRRCATNAEDGGLRPPNGRSSRGE